MQRTKKNNLCRRLWNGLELRKDDAVFIYGSSYDPCSFQSGKEKDHHAAGSSPWRPLSSSSLTSSSSYGREAFCETGWWGKYVLFTVESSISTIANIKYSIMPMASSTQDLIPHVQVQLVNTFGALFIGVIIAAVNNILQAGLINYANIGALIEFIWSCKLQLVVTVFTIFVEHLYFPPINRFIVAYAVNLVSKGRSKVLPIIVGVVVVLTSAAIWYMLFDEYVFNDNYHYIYVNSYIALLNARHYAQPNADAVHSSECHICHDVYRPGLHVRASQDDGHPDEMLQITRHVQAVTRPIEVTMKINSLSSA
ncbi:hypothetical protein DFJ58DRAFT_912710 [Suillus subalutaceus]|uniref:uncharacterized protein n=1 Tax=Suillus subalutaceus TaxID=48586 RepID=UPI001B86829D|nr:uncharacterized protein DFJ58DRAFT_912710 [Suillus subalutaceus]KAG1861769.1 hypothetical protein DFJ58DRAFT_912710 [Suillus subalutaceus]